MPSPIAARAIGPQGMLLDWSERVLQDHRVHYQIGIGCAIGLGFE